MTHSSASLTAAGVGDLSLTRGTHLYADLPQSYPCIQAHSEEAGEQKPEGGAAGTNCKPAMDHIAVPGLVCSPLLRNTQIVDSCVKNGDFKVHKVVGSKAFMGAMAALASGKRVRHPGAVRPHQPRLLPLSSRRVCVGVVRL